jgi:hypothetical protein
VLTAKAALGILPLMALGLVGWQHSPLYTDNNRIRKPIFAMYAVTVF